MSISKFFDIVQEQNRYCNHNGQIPRSTFINRWHSLTNGDVQAILVGATEFMGIRKVSDRTLLQQIRRVGEYLLSNQQFHSNVCNPSLKDEKNLVREYGKNFTTVPDSGKKIKTEFFQMMMRFRELYNREMNIIIENKDSDIGVYDLDWDGLDPEWIAPTQFEKVFDYEH